MSDANPTTTDTASTTTDDQLDKEFATTTSIIGSDTAGDAPDGATLLPGIEFLGCGYDVFGGFADTASVKMNLFDFSDDTFVNQALQTQGLTAEQIASAFTSVPSQVRVTYTRPKKVTYEPIFETDIEYQSTGSKSDEQSKLAVSAGLSVEFGAFGGELEGRYDSSNSKLASTKYYSATAFARYYQVALLGYPSPDLHGDQLPVKPDVLADLDNAALTPQEIFDNYGTHFLWAVTIGCSIIYSQTVDTSKLSSSFDAAVELKARYEGVSGHAKTDLSASSASEADAEEVRTQFKGIDEDQLDTDGKEDGGKSLPLKALRGGWHHPVLIDLPKNSLKPIWLLCSDPARKTELQAAFTALAKQNHAAIAGAGADGTLRALYLMKRSDVNYASYRLWPHLDGADVSPGTWAAVDKSPYLYVYATQHTGTIPLFEYYVDTPSTGCYRYETSAYSSYLSTFNTRWIKVSATPVGYVYDSMVAPVASDSDDIHAEPIYAYYPKNTGGNFRCYYSTDSADSRDNAGWKPQRLPEDDGWNANGSTYMQPVLKATVTSLDPSQTAVFAHERNALSDPVVHWRSPSF